jgi:hypothetical protein
MSSVMVAAADIAIGVTDSAAFCVGAYVLHD